MKEGFVISGVGVLDLSWARWKSRPPFHPIPRRLSLLNKGNLKSGISYAPASLSYPVTGSWRRRALYGARVHRVPVGLFVNAGRHDDIWSKLEYNM